MVDNKGVIIFTILGVLGLFPNINAQSLSQYLEQKSKIAYSGDFKKDLIETAKLFIGTPYKAGALEQSPEDLVIDFTGLDCSTFVENAISLTLSKDEASYKKTLAKLRYRKGLIDGYSSRIHYLSEWIINTSHQGIFHSMSNGGDLCFEPQLHFMSEHPNYYNVLKNDASMVDKIKYEEDRFNDHLYGFDYYSRAKFKDGYLQHGDIVAFKSKKQGLDFDHLGLVVNKGGKMHLLHASLDYKKVLITKETVQEYFNRISKFDGILIIR